MRVEVSQKTSGIFFEFTPDAEDPLSDGYCTFASSDAFIECDVPLNTMHPDLVAMTALLIVGEFAGDIEVSRPVSPQFAAAAKAYRKGKDFGPSSSEVKPHRRPENWVPGLSFSGGVDSYAALQLMPESTECYFLSSFPEKDGRVHPKSSESGRRACQDVRELGRTAIEVRSNLEFVRSVVGLPDHLACAIPLILNADYRGIGSATFGSIAEAAYRTGVSTYTEPSDRGAYRKIHDIFAAVDIPVHNVVVGLSEVVTTKIVASGPHAGKAQSCMLGGQEACGRCVKCVRKSLIEMAVSGRWKPADDIRLMLSIAKPHKAIKSLPMKLENVFAYIAWKCPHDDEFSMLLKKRLRVDRLSMAWMEKIIPSSANWMIDELRPDALARLSQYASFMTPSDLESAKAFDLREIAKDPDVGRAHEDFLGYLSTI